ncbi:MAG: FG-GAP repeat protein [Gammaproteobacteria bacterium]|nr:FG-GAP repeat protein [Gammaproteobacteria bacterium]
MNEAAFNAGAAYVFVRDGNGLWSQQAYIKSANSETRDLFGWSIALGGDTLLVGATGEASASTGVNSEPGNNDADEAGAAYVFVRSAGLWSQSTYIKPSNTGAEDQFGIGVAVSGDTLAIGARAEDSDGIGIDPIPDNDAADSGAGYVYFRE